MSKQKYKLTIYPAYCLDHTASKEMLFSTVDEMKAARNACADLLLFMQDEMTIMNDYSNMFIEEQFVDGEWEEIDEEEVKLTPDPKYFIVSKDPAGIKTAVEGLYLIEVERQE